MSHDRLLTPDDLSPGERVAQDRGERLAREIRGVPAAWDPDLAIPAIFRMGMQVGIAIGMQDPRKAEILLEETRSHQSASSSSMPIEIATEILAAMAPPIPTAEESRRIRVTHSLCRRCQIVLTADPEGICGECRAKGISS